LEGSKAYIAHFGKNEQKNLQEKRKAVLTGLKLATADRSCIIASMNLVTKIDADLKAAMIARDAEKLSVLRMLKSAVKYAAIEKGGADSVPTDLEVVAAIRKEAKKREDSITSFTQGGRPELADKEKAELAILKTYLPAQLTPEKMEALVREAIAEVGATSKAQMGAVMKSAQAKAAGQADGKTLSQIVQRLLP
jgi:hypothetical protein